MARSGQFYMRFMDDILVLTPTRWKLRKAVKAVNEVLGSLRMEKHPDKTFIGRIEKGFDFLGYQFNPAGLTVAHEPFVRFVAAKSWTDICSSGIPLSMANDVHALDCRMG